MASTLLVFLSIWATQAHASILKTQSFRRSSASVRLEVEPHHVYVEAFDQQHHLRLQPTYSPFLDRFRLQTTSRDKHGNLILEDIENRDDMYQFYEDPEAGSMVYLTAAGLEGLISPSLALKITDNGQHEAVHQHFKTQLRDDTNDYLEIPQETSSYHQSSAISPGVTTATVEMYIIVDSALAAKLGSNEKVKQYLGVFWNAVNLRFATITDPQIKLVLVGALVVRDPSDETYITENILTENYISGKKTLFSLGNWLFEQKRSLPPHDMVYLMTGKDLVSEKNGVIQKGLAGIAWRGTACVLRPAVKRSFNVAIGEDFSYYSGVMTAVHEVAHNLGSPHDGKGGSKKCSWDDGYIMSYVQDGSNKLFFSSCSKIMMKKFISGKKASCLRTTSGTDQIALSPTLPGEDLSMDQQCQAATGQSKAYASKRVSDDSLCVHLGHHRGT
ncbi:venom metalloproteinase antarease-like TtrivMP_A [Portunus trituberculatus]|uniref:venom metalloproteinase antarease-like TtrivMP_A n=1 Tax=Portunus trituberculatus TaxID=210409 RepID=UPI001E1CC213|nr:venom metalloproteinase antarease-like TtrivMP_A [Portunus trituberculatus]